MTTLLDTRNLPSQSAPRYFEGLQDESTSVALRAMPRRRSPVWQFERRKTQLLIGLGTEFIAKISIDSEATVLNALSERKIPGKHYFRTEK